MMDFAGYNSAKWPKADLKDFPVKQLFFSRISVEFLSELE